MKKTLSRTVHMLSLLMVAMMAFLFVSCGSDDNPTGPKASLTPAETMAGSYVSNYRWGGASGLWRGSNMLVITSDGKVSYQNKEIINPTITNDQISWLMADGNSQNAQMTYHLSSDDDFFWRDKGGVNERNFTGWIQNPGEGKLDFRALIQ